MPKVQGPLFNDHSEGIIQGITEAIMPKNSVYMAVNFLFHEVLGRATLRKGSTQIGEDIVAGAECLGMHQFIDGATRVPLATFNDAASSPANADIYKYTSGAWSKSAENLTKDLKTRFLTFLGTCAFVNGTEAKSSTDLTTWVSTGGNLDIGNMNKGTLINEWHDRVYLAGKTSNPDRLYYSSTPTGGAISWTVGNGFIDIEPDDNGGGITALSKCPGYELIFKERSLKRWDFSSTYPDDLMNIGAPSQEAVVEGNQSVFFFNQKGIYETIGSYPRKISRRVQDIINAIPSTYYSKVSGISDDENLLFNIGTVTLDKVTLSNCVLLYNYDSKTWSLLSFQNKFLHWSPYVDANGAKNIMAGDATGKVMQIFNGTQDAGKDIKWLLQYQTQEMGSRGRIKDLSKMVAYTKGVRNGQTSIRINGVDDFKPIRQTIDKDVKELTMDLKGRYFDMRMQGFGQTGIHVIGWEFPDVNANLNFSE